MKRSARLSAVFTVAACFALGSYGVAPAAAAAQPCDSMTSPIFEVVNPRNQASLLTRWEGEATKAVAAGFAEGHGEPFKAAADQGPGLVPVHRLYNPQTSDFVWISDPAEIATAIAKYGYADHGVGFYAASEASACTTPLERFTKKSMHRFAASTDEGSKLKETGWTSEGVGFYVVAPEESPTSPVNPGDDSKFTIAILPDTQQEIFPRDPRFLDRTSWLTANEASLDLRFVLHTGDVVNWDTPDHSQYEVASKATLPLEAASIPYSLSIGNHDTMATGVGGAARDPKRTREYLRDTRTFNRYFSAERFAAVGGEFEKGKVDNVYSTFTSSGESWMVLSLELWPRKSVVDWAQRVVQEHPRHNVIISTHSYLTADGGISDRSDYGATSPQYLFDHLVSVYPNIKLVFSGHVGRAASRVDTGASGNKIVSYLGAFHSNTTNPVRLVEINTDDGSLSTRILGPSDGTSYPEYAETQVGMDWDR